MDITIIIPTFEEPGIGTLLKQLDAVTTAEQIRCEVVVVDDSPTSETAQLASAARVRFPVRVLRRPESANGTWGGLSGAVLDGCRAAQAERALVMDGDGQHPPEAVPAVVRGLDHADVVIASRYCHGGGAGGLADSYRRWISSASTLLARGLFYRRVGQRTTDPMTGFFAVRLAAIDTEAVARHAVGFKVLLALLVTHRTLHVVEVPFTFADRLVGTSKAGWRNGAAFMRQVVAMRLAA